ncbi:hypothetical protein [Mycobacterium sp.]|uniref:hypothetical protein n=1 Tax=Mycobacterium sp. TaxID=1785 RepID=UPI003F9A1AFF
MWGGGLHAADRAMPPVGDIDTTSVNLAAAGRYWSGGGGGGGVVHITPGVGSDGSAGGSGAQRRGRRQWLVRQRQRR